MKYVGMLLLVALILVSYSPVSTQQLFDDQAFLVTFGKECPTHWGDDDFIQEVLIRVPLDFKETVHIQVFDPECGGQYDEINRNWNTQTTFILLGAAGAMNRREFGEDPAADARWMTLFSASADQGEMGDNYYQFKLRVEGGTGDDGNLYHVRASLSNERMTEIAGVDYYLENVCFRQPELENEVIELNFDPPLANETPVDIYTFDNDDPNIITLFTPVRPNLVLRNYGNNQNVKNTFRVQAGESVDIWTLRIQRGPSHNNDMAIYVEDGVKKEPLLIHYPIRIAPLNRAPEIQTETTTPNLSDCQTVAFDASATTDPDGDNMTFEWNFGDGQTGSGIKTTHRYTQPGTYQAMVTVTDNSKTDCKVSTHVIPVVINQPPVAEAGLNQTGCPDETFQFDGTRSYDRDGQIATYSWDFGDGESASGKLVTHKFARPGQYKVKLTVTDDSGTTCDTASDELAVTINQPPIANAGPDQKVGILTVSFDGTQSHDPEGDQLTYIWDFGDSSPLKMGATPVHTYRQPGTYQATLTVRDQSNTECNEDVDDMIVIINEPPVADPGDPQIGCVNESISFDAGRSKDNDGSIIKYHWDFGDGATADGPNPTHTYAGPGVYTVTLTVDDDSGTNVSRDINVTQVTINQPPTAVIGNIPVVCVNGKVNFDGSLSYDPDGFINDYIWDFGDGQIGTGPNPVHYYNESGTYDVKLTVRDNSGTDCAEVSARSKVIVNEPPVAVHPDDIFTCSSTVEFDGSQSYDPDGKVVEYLWNFGDGTIGSGLKVAHLYPEKGVYNVTLTVRDDSGTRCDTHSTSFKVIFNHPPMAEAGQPITVCTGETVHFDGMASQDVDGNLTAYEWDFGDGSITSAGVKAAHVYNQPGNYVARLTVTDNSGGDCNTGIAYRQITVNTPPIAEAGPDQSICVDQDIHFSGKASHDPDGLIKGYQWDFGDGSPIKEKENVIHSYVAPGVYTVTMTVFDASGTACNKATDQLTVYVNHPPVAVPGDNVETCLATVNFDGSASTDADNDNLTYSWDFGDGSPTQRGVKANHTFARAGNYPVTLTVCDDSETSCHCDSQALSVFINEPPVADAGGDVSVCSGELVVFNGSRSFDPEGSILRYWWDFGDGSPEADGVVSPTHTYDKSGVYTATLTVTDDSGLECNTSSDKIVVTVSESPVAKAGEDLEVCASTAVKFDGTRSTDSDGVVNSYHWDFGDGTFTGGATPTHSYAEPGEYVVTLTVTGDDVVGNCKNTSSDQLIVNVLASPVAETNDDKITCVGDPVAFDGSRSRSDISPIVSYTWDFGDGTTGSGPNPDHTYRTPGVYVVSLTVTNDSGTECNTDVDQLKVVVNDRPVAAAGPDQTTCVSDLVRFNANASVDHDGSIISYLWDFGDGSTASGVNTVKRYIQSGQYPVKLTVTDNSNTVCNSQVDELIININQPPIADAGVDQIVCVGQSFSLDANNSTDPDGAITGYEWILGDGATKTGQSVTHTFTQPGIYDVALRVTDNSGTVCASDMDGIRITVNRGPLAEAGADKFICAEQPVQFDGTQSLDPDGQIASYQWDFGDGQIGEGPQPTHIYAASGRYEVVLTVADATNTDCGRAADKLIVVVNEPPVADAGVDLLDACVGCVYDDVQFDGTASYDPEGGRLFFSWDFGDGNYGTGPSPNHAYAAPGVYTVTLTVTDDSGLPCNKATATITVKANRPPDPEVKKQQ